MLSLVYILCDSIFKDIGQFKSGFLIFPFDSYSSFNQLYILFASKVWRNLKKFFSERANDLFYFEGLSYFYSQTLVNWTRRTIHKMETLSISLVVAEKLSNHIEIADFFFTRKFYFLLTLNLLVIKTEYFLITFLFPFSDAIIGFEKLLNLVNNLREKKF